MYFRNLLCGILLLGNFVLGQVDKKKGCAFTGMEHKQITVDFFLAQYGPRTSGSFNTTKPKKKDWPF